MTAITVHVPNSFKYLCPCEDNAEIGSKEYESAVFKTGKADFLSILKYPALVLPYFQIGRSLREKPGLRIVEADFGRIKAVVDSEQVNTVID